MHSVPAHCIQWASVLHWDEVKPFGAHPADPKKAVPIDTDNPEHMKWLYEKALARAKEHHIEGVTYKLTQVRFRASPFTTCLTLFRVL